MKRQIHARKQKQTKPRNYSFGNRIKREIWMDAIAPIGTTGLLVEHLNQLITEYLTEEHNKECLTEEWRGQSMDLRLLKQGYSSRGQAYRITISLQEVYGYPKMEENMEGR